MFEFILMIYVLYNVSNIFEIIDILMDWYWIYFKCFFGFILVVMLEKVRWMMIMERLYRVVKVIIFYNWVEIFIIKIE